MMAAMRAVRWLPLLVVVGFFYWTVALSIGGLGLSVALQAWQSDESMELVPGETRDGPAEDESTDADDPSGCPADDIEVDLQSDDTLPYGRTAF